MTISMTSAVLVGSRIASGALGWVLIGGPVDGASPGSGSPIPPVAPTGHDLGAVLLTVAVVFLLIGFARGATRELQSVAVTGVAFVVIPWQWPFIVQWANRFHRLFVFAVIKRGILLDDPTEAWQSVRASTELIGADASVAVWQLVMFSAAVVAGYGLSSRIRIGPRGDAAVVYYNRLPRFVERLVGALLGAVAGNLVGVFALSRLVPGAHFTRLRPATVLNVLPDWAPTAIAGAVTLILITFGVASMGARKKKVYD